MDTRQAFLEGMSQAASSVTVVTTDGAAGKAGLTVSAMCSVTADDPALLICVNRSSGAGELIAQNRRFCVHLLRDDQANISNIFAGLGDGDRFEAASWTSLETGSPVLDDHLVAFDCKLVKEDVWGTHRIFIGEVVATSLSQGDALLYVNRHYARPADIVAAA
ncbi:MAG: flavin reductase family protein [Alphaproteobacteria bacterium]|jgi:flavin reductase|nr:flavin reductase [Rhodospirillaceae bacterium]MDG2482794.1 flavin reductase family protein [Alphaproteobacteria bacterium]MBT6202325.1 flavin reductase [Rhodospirillaceae bacterium]MBT6510312.1 flavin reductase [Rhodospirillaceae bacterium]MBT7611698.1 flavin reductase [Rhodospirillaceae bacterium]